MKLRHLPTLCTALLVLCPALVTAQTSAVPSFISYQGRVVDAAGANVGTGTPVNRTVIFRVWDSPSSTNTANLIYSESQTVTVSEGEFSVLVGQGVANATQTFGYSETAKKLTDLGTAFGGSARYLGVTVASAATIALTDNEITPRQQIVSTAFAMRAKFAESISSSSDLTLTPLSGTASNNGLGWYGTGRPFGTTAVDGPVLYGNSGGALGSNNGTQKLALNWDASGRVGIGATSIASLTNKLTLQGDMATTPADQLTIRGNADNNKRLLLGYDTTANKASLQSYTASSTVGPLLLNPSGGNVGVNNTAPGVALDVTGAINASGAITTAAGSLTTNTGNIGIGTTAPVARFQLDDGLNTGTYASALITRPTNSHTGSHMAFVRSGAQVMGVGYAPSVNTFGFGQGVSGVAFSPGYLAIDQNNGNVGIGIASPTAKLDVNGNTYVRGQINLDGSIVMGNGTIWGTNGAGVAEQCFWPRSSNGTYLNYGTAGFYIRNNASTTTMFMTDTGRVGIGTTDPGAPLHVAKKFDLQYTSSAVTNANGTFTPQLGNADGYTAAGSIAMNGQYWQTSIYADGAVAGSAFVAMSDLRIKDVVNRSSTQSDLALINQLQVTDYRLKDSIANGTAIRKGFIAQEVRKIVPEAVSPSPNFIPDIYVLATQSIYDAAQKHLSVTLAKPHALAVGEWVRIYGNDDTMETKVLTVESATSFTVASEKPVAKAFVYGRRVDDFLTVDYDRLFTTGIGAIQDLSRQMKSLQDENAALRRELAAKDREHAATNASHEARLIALERSISKEGATETVSLSTAKTAD